MGYNFHKFFWSNIWGLNMFELLLAKFIQLLPYLTEFRPPTIDFQGEGAKILSIFNQGTFLGNKTNIKKDTLDFLGKNLGFEWGG